MAAAKVNPDLEKERRKCTFNTLELTYFLDGGIEKYKERKSNDEYFLSDPELREKIPSEYLSQEDQYRESLRKSAILLKKVQTLKTGDDKRNYRDIISNRVRAATFKYGDPLSVATFVFPPTLMTQATDEQREYWTKRVNDLKAFVTYAQTELGHGTFLRGLETTATYHPESQEFEIHSPTLSSYKWWPGGLGHTANYAVVVAQLYTKGQCHGVHLFIVQIRDEKTYQPLPGIKVGDIGQKFGMNATNNGFIAFNKVRIPRNQMLMKNAQVLQDGTYVKSSANSKLAYGSMIYVRVLVAYDMGFNISRAVTIAVRYSAIRRQSELKPGEKEAQILDFQTQQYKLLPWLASTYAIRFSVAWLIEFYDKTIASVHKGDTAQLPDLHAMACCLKAVCSKDAAQAVETVRLACGGHGFMTCSNLPIIYADVAAANTYEGENTVLLLQTARALVKAWGKVRAGQPVSSIMAYLASNKVTTKFNDLNSIVHAFKQTAAGKVARCSEMLRRSTTSGLAPEIAWNSASVQLVEAAEAHCRAFLVERYVDALNTHMNGLSPELRAVMQQLCELYCVFWILCKRGDFMQNTGMSTSDVMALEDWQSRLLTQLRPNAVGLVDAFDFRDEVLGSALGAWDGQAYQRLLDNAMKSPLNAKPVHDSFYASLAPMLKAKY